MAEHYNVPHIHARSVLGDIQNFDKAKREEYEHRVSEKKRISELFTKRAEELKVALAEAKERQGKRDQAKRRRQRRRANPEEYADSEEEGAKKEEEQPEEDEDNIEREQVTSPKNEEEEGAAEPVAGEEEGDSKEVDPLLAAY